mgnify:CR=1 FL=1
MLSELTHEPLSLPSGKLRFASLGSGSKGNATVVSDGETTLLVDCGFGLRDTERRLARLGVHPRQLDAVLVSHEHVDHLRGVMGYRSTLRRVPGSPAAWEKSPCGTGSRPSRALR